MKPNEIGLLIRNARKEKGIPQREVGKWVGIRNDKICAIEKGKMPKSMQRFFLMLDNLGLIEKKNISANFVDFIPETGYNIHNEIKSPAM